MGQHRRPPPHVPAPTPPPATHVHALAAAEAGAAALAAERAPALQLLLRSGRRLRLPRARRFHLSCRGERRPKVVQLAACSMGCGVGCEGEGQYKCLAPARYAFFSAATQARTQSHPAFSL